MLQLLPLLVKVSSSGDIKYKKTTLEKFVLKEEIL
jgi:hypothetical protein